MPINRDDRSIFEYALQQLERDQARINALIEKGLAALQRTGRPLPAAPDSSIPDWVLSASEKASRSAADQKPARKKRTLSPEARASIAAAQKKRWADFHKKAKETKAEPKKPAAKKKRGKKAS